MCCNCKFFLASHKTFQIYLSLIQDKTIFYGNSRSFGNAKKFVRKICQVQHHSILYCEVLTRSFEKLSVPKSITKLFRCIINLHFFIQNWFFKLPILKSLYKVQSIFIHYSTDSTIPFYTAMA